MSHRRPGNDPSQPRHIQAVALLVALALTASARTAHSDSAAPGQATITADSAVVIGNGSNGPYWLSGYFIINGSESLVGPGSVGFDSTQYTLDANHGLLVLREPLGAGDTLIARFQRLAFVLATEWSESDDQPQATTPSSGPLIQNVSAVEFPAAPGQPRRTPPPSTRADGQTIEWQGFKSFSVSTSSNQGSDWSQGLELSLDGEIGDGVHVRGAISDRFANSLSNRSRGPVTRVGDLDRLFLEAKSQRFFGRFGQVDLPSLTSGQPLRQAAGARVSMTGNTHAVDGYIGRATGTPVRRRLATQPQIAGPYQLSGEGTYGNVIPATVVVTKDGTRLTEGPNADFIFDLATGSITFGPDAVPDAGTIVIVEYERALDEYRRTLAGASWNASQTDSPVHHNLSVSWEADDPETPLFGELSDAQRAVLSQSANGSVAVPSYEYHGHDEGDYDLNLTPDEDTIFTYVGPGNGDWRVGFEYVGAGQGRYRHLAEDAFEYVGAAGGSYEPITTLGAPQSYMTLSESVQLSQTAIGSLDAQWFGFIDDPNRFAADNTQFKSNHHLGWSTGDHAPNANTDRLRLDWWRHGAVPARTRAVDDFTRFTNTWRLRESLFDDSRDEYQLAAASSSARAVNTSIETGIVSSPEIDAIRWNVSTTTRPTEHLSTLLQWSQRIGRSNQNSSADHDQWRELSTSVHYIHNAWTLTSAWSQRDLRNSLLLFENGARYVSTKSLALGYSTATLEYKWLDSFDSLLVRHRTRELAFSTPLDPVPSVDGDLLVARGEQSYRSESFTPYYRGRFDGGWHPYATAAVNVQMDLAYTRSGLEQEVYLPTRPGQGQYRLERGEYIPDAHGDYRRVVSRSDQAGPASYEGRQTIDAHWRPTVAGWRWALEMRRDRLARHDPANFAAFTWLAPWTPYTWNSAAGARAERHDYHRLSARPNRGTELTIDYASDRTVFGFDRIRNTRDRVGVTARRDISPRLYVEGGGDAELRQRTGGTGTGVDADATALRAAIGGTPIPRTSWSVETRRRIDQDHISDANVRLLGVKPRAQAGVNAITVVIESDLTWVQPRNGTTTFSSLLAEGRPEGFSAVEFCEVRWQLPGKITLKSRFHADLRQNGDDRWRWDVQTVARF